MASTTLPAGWANRLVPVSNENTAGAIGWCLDVHDLALSKLVAGRDRDLELAVVRRAAADGGIGGDAPEQQPARFYEEALMGYTYLEDPNAD